MTRNVNIYLCRYLYTCLIMIASDLNARFGAKGKAMAIRISPAYTSKFCVEISQ